jgi:hypothetical protein
MCDDLWRLEGHPAGGGAATREEGDAAVTTVFRDTKNNSKLQFSNQLRHRVHQRVESYENNTGNGGGELPSVCLSVCCVVVDPCSQK